MKNTIVIFLVLLLFCKIISGGTIDPDTKDEKYIKYAKDFKCVVKLCGMKKDGSLYCGSAVIIKPNYILTAAHVISDSKSCYVSIDDKNYEITNIIKHKDFNEKNHGYYDIAIGYSEKIIDLDFYPSFYTKDDEIGRVCSISGYGITGTFDTGAKISDDKRRAGSNIVEEIDRQLLICRPSKRSKDFTELEFLIASGDSGGGLFIDGKLAGINSCVIGNNKDELRSTYDTSSGHTRISIHKEWIEKNTTQDK